MKPRTHRRDFLRQSTAAGVGLWVVGSRVVRGDESPNEKVNVAIIGVGGRGEAHVEAIPQGRREHRRPLRRRRPARLGKAAEKHPEARSYNDFRKMLDERHKEIDAVVVSTPDHTHAVGRRRWR